MLIDKPITMGREKVHIRWQRDPETLNLISLHTESGTARLLGFPLSVFQDMNEWYERMVPEDVGKELLLLSEIYQKGRGRIRYRIRGRDGSEWLVTETAEMKVPEEGGKRVLSGEWICEKK